MKLTKPDYFDTFRCLADSCPDSCCQEWEVQVDEASARRYRALPGPLGDRLRQVLKEEDGETVMAIEQGRCRRSPKRCSISRRHSSSIRITPTHGIIWNT